MVKLIKISNLLKSVISRKNPRKHSEIAQLYTT